MLGIIMTSTASWAWLLFNNLPRNITAAPQLWHTQQRCVHARRLETCLHQAKHAAASLQVHSNSWGAAKLDVDVYMQVGIQLACFKHTRLISVAAPANPNTCAAHILELYCCTITGAHHINFTW